MTLYGEDSLRRGSDVTLFWIGPEPKSYYDHFSRDFHHNFTKIDARKYSTFLRKFYMVLFAILVSFAYLGIKQAFSGDFGTGGLLFAIYVVIGIIYNVTESATYSDMANSMKKLREGLHRRPDHLIQSGKFGEAEQLRLEFTKAFVSA